MAAPVLAPVPLTILRSNSKSDQNMQHSSSIYTLPITTKFCTRHDSVTVVTWAKSRCDLFSAFQTRALQILIEFRIRSKNRYWDGRLCGPESWTSHVIPTFGNRCLSAIGGGKQRSRLAGWVQLSAEATPGPHGVPPVPPCAENLGRPMKT